MTQDLTMRPPAVARASLEAWWTLAVVFLLYVFSIIDRHLITMMVPDIKASLRLSDFQMGVVLGPAFSICYAAFGLPLGWSADRFSRRWIIFGGVVVFGLATASAALATAFLGLFLSRIMVGVGEAALSPASYSLMSQKFPRNQQTTASSIYNMAGKIGLSLAYAIGGVAIPLAGAMHVSAPGFGVLEPWRLVFAMTGASAAVCALLVFTFREPVRPPRAAAGAPKALGELWAFLKAERATIAPMFLGAALMGMCSFGLQTWAPSYLGREFHLKPGQYGPVLSAISMATALAMVLKGVIVDWLYSRGMKDAHLRFYTWILVCSLPLAATVFLVKDPLTFMVLYALVQVVATPVVVYITAAIQVVAPANLRGQVIAAFLVVFAVAGGGLGPLVIGTLTDYLFHDEAKVGYSMAVLLCVAMPIALVCLRRALKPFGRMVVASEA